MFRGERLNQRRRELGFSQEVLASRSGIVKGTLWFWENDRSVPKVGELERVAVALGVSVDYFLDGKDKEGNPLKGKIDFTATPSFFGSESPPP